MIGYAAGIRGAAAAAGSHRRHSGSRCCLPLTNYYFLYVYIYKMLVCWFGKDRECECVICQNTFLLKNGITCSKGHFLCKEDFQQYCQSFVESCVNNPSALRLRKGRIHCPMHSLSQIKPSLTQTVLAPCRSGPYPHSRVIQNTTDGLGEVCVSFEQEYIRAENLMAESICKSDILIRDMRRILYDPRQCGACGFGPVEINGCSNLLSRHDEQRSSARISNACPACDWFDPSGRIWPAWNGRVWSTPAGPPEPIPAPPRLTATAGWLPAACAASAPGAEERPEAAQDYRYKTRPCRAFEGGGCRQGAACFFLHGPDDPMSRVRRRQQAQQAPESAAAASGTAAAGHDDDGGGGGGGQPALARLTREEVLNAQLGGDSDINSADSDSGSRRTN